MFRINNSIKQFISVIFCLIIISTTSAQLKLPYFQFQLNNGLKVLINQDTTINEVALYLFAEAGFSKEQPGQHGMAHLFEHVIIPKRHITNAQLLRNSAQHNINRNAQVFNDHVRFYAHYDKNGLDYGLLTLADRLDFTIDSLSESALQTHKNNVNSELARQESFGSFRWRPVFRENLAEGLFGSAHPYGHEQSLVDINRASRKDIENWFRRNYGASNSTLIIIGYVDTATVKSKIERYFGGIEPGSFSLKSTIDVPVITRTKADHLLLPQKKHVIYIAWTLPGYGSAANDCFELMPYIFSDPLKGRLIKALKSKGISGVSSFSKLETYKHASVFDIGFEFADWNDKDKLILLLEEEVKQFLKSALPKSDIQYAFNKYHLDFIQAMEGIGLNDQRVVELSSGQLFINNPTYFETRISNLKIISPENFSKVVSGWLQNEPYKIIIEGHQLKADVIKYDYKQNIPYQSPSAPAYIPIEKIKINEKISIHLIRQDRVPLINFQVAFENTSNIDLVSMQWYAKSVTEFMEDDPFFESILSMGVKRDTKLTDKLLTYKLTVKKEDAPRIYHWLIKRLNTFTVLGRATSLTNPLPENDLVQLKKTNTVSFNDPFYPLSHIHLIVTGSIDLIKKIISANDLRMDLAQIKNVALTPVQGNPSRIVINDIGETPTSFITVAHLLAPETLEEAMYQKMLLYILRERLMNNLRERNSLIYEIYPFKTTIAGHETLAYWQTSTPVQKTHSALQQIESELKAISENLEMSVQGSTSRVITEMKSNFSSLNSIDNTIIESIENNQSEDYFSRAIKVLNNIDTAKFINFIKEKAAPEDFRIIISTASKQVKVISGK